MHCRICQCNKLTCVINLGQQVITSRFPKMGDYNTPSTPIKLVMCDDCKLVQLEDTVNSSELYEQQYGYRSGLNNTMKQHLAKYNLQLQDIVNLKSGDSVLDIGSNDATFLKCYPDWVDRIGIDPTGKQFAEYYGNIRLLPTYFTREAIVDNYDEEKKFKIVTSISMFYDLPYPVQFAKDIESLLASDGIWSLEQSYIVTMIERNSIDTICHEHLEYYGMNQIKRIMDAASLKIISVEKNDCNGGSFRIIVAKQNSKYVESLDVEKYIKVETEMQLTELQTFTEFINKCNVEVNKLTEFLRAINTSGQKMYIYGASTKGNCLLQYANIGPELIQYAVERNLQKVGCMTSTGIEIISEETMRANPPEYLLVLPWHFKDEIIEREAEFLNGGGQIVFPFPSFTIISKKPRVLITGIDGQIGHYVSQQFSKTHSVFGITKELKIKDKYVTKYAFDIANFKMLKTAVLSVQPDVIVHLAGISNTEICIANPKDAGMVNGYATVELCDIILKNNLKTKLFNASSSELYKGHLNYTITDNDDNMRATHPYSFAKQLGHLMLNFYRDKCNLPLYNGILFTTESSRRSELFLFSKMAKHILSKATEPLTVGSLDSCRTILHAYDVAEAIYCIMTRGEPQNYVICGDNPIKVQDMVQLLYKCVNIETEFKGGNLVNKSNGEILLKITAPLRGASTQIHGANVLLKELGWHQSVTNEMICRELLHQIDLNI